LSVFGCLDVLVSIEEKCSGYHTYGSDDHSSFCWIIAQCPRLYPLRAQLPNTANTLVCPRCQVGHADDFILDVEELIAREGKGRSFPFEFENDQTVIVTWDSDEFHIQLAPPNSPAAKRFNSGCSVKTQNLSCSLLNVWTAVLFVISHTLIVLSSLADRINSCLGWNMVTRTLLKWPRQLSTSHALVSLILQSLICRSSPHETISGSVGWKEAQLTPRSWPSKTYLTTASVFPNKSA
jgi:hypothetical protein